MYISAHTGILILIVLVSVGARFARPIILSFSFLWLFLCNCVMNFDRVHMHFG